MSLTLQDLIVLPVVLVAAGYLTLATRRALKARSGCTSCSGCTSKNPNVPEVVSLTGLADKSRKAPHTRSQEESDA